MVLLRVHQPLKKMALLKFKKMSTQKMNPTPRTSNLQVDIFTRAQRLHCSIDIDHPGLTLTHDLGFGLKVIDLSPQGHALVSIAWGLLQAV